MAFLKLTPAQHSKVMNHPVHYNLNSMRYVEKSDCYECECEAADAKVIKELVDEPK